MVAVLRPACNVRRNDAEITPGPAILLLTQNLAPTRSDPQPKGVLVLPGSGLY